MPKKDDQKPQAQKPNKNPKLKPNPEVNPPDFDNVQQGAQPSDKKTK